MSVDLTKAHGRCQLWVKSSNRDSL